MKRVIVFLACLALCFSCKELESLMNLTTNCEFKVDKVNNYQVAGFTVGDKRSIKDFGLLDGLTLGKAIATKNLPIQLDVNIGVENKGTETRLNTLEWIALLDGENFVSGLINEQIVLPAQGKGNIPLTVQANLFEVFKGKNTETILETALSLLGQKNSAGRYDNAKLSFKVKPTFTVAGQSIQSPNYINIGL